MSGGVSVVQPSGQHQGVALAGEVPVAVYHLEREMGVGVVAGLDEQGCEVAESTSTVEDSAID